MELYDLPGQLRNVTSENTVRFVLDGQVIKVRNAEPTRTVLQYLREDLRRIGTKEGCAEGDCGACTVAVAEIDSSGERLQIRAVNSCIQFLPTLDGKELITVESLCTTDRSLHPVQQALIDHHASQCGFCTPGFAMSLFALYKNNASPSRREIDDVLAGNLCRCTGYRPIIEAAQAMYAGAQDKYENSDWMRAPYCGGGKVTAGEKQKIGRLKSLRRSKSLHIETDNCRFFAPQALPELAGLVVTYPDAVILAGGTDLALRVTKQYQALATIIYTGNVRELTKISVTDTHLEIGAGVTLTQAMPEITARYPELEELFLRFGSPPIRNVATVGGNIANGSPVGDSMPALMVLDTALILRQGDQTRRVALADFYLNDRSTALGPAEFIERIMIPLPDGDTQLQSYKVSKRFDQDTSAVCGAYWLRLNGTTVVDVRIAYGGMAEIPKRATACEEAVRGAEWSEETVRSAMPVLKKDFRPISDMRSSSVYRQKVCQNLLYRFYLETRGSDRVRVYDYGR